MMAVHESGLVFGPYAEQDCFIIEKSPALKKLGDYLKIAEFIVRLNLPRQALAIVEAKSSIPQESHQFLQDIKIKLINALTLLFAAWVGRHRDMQAELPEHLKASDWQSISIKLYLVIALVPDQQLAPLTDKFRNLLMTECKLWAIPSHDLWVLNERTAKKAGLIVSF